VFSEIKDPYGSTMASNWSAAHWWVNVETSYTVPENGAEGDYEVESRHYMHPLIDAEEAVVGFSSPSPAYS
jgi:hypothetical protein